MLSQEAEGHSGAVGTGGCYREPFAKEFFNSACTGESETCRLVIVILLYPWAAVF